MAAKPLPVTVMADPAGPVFGLTAIDGLAVMVKIALAKRLLLMPMAPRLCGPRGANRGITTWVVNEPEPSALAVPRSTVPVEQVGV